MAACAAAYVLSAILIVAISVPYGSMPSNRGDMSAAEFSDNYNDLAAFIDFGEYERMTPDGLMTDMPPNIFVRRVTDGGSIPEFTLTGSGGLLTRVEFTAEKSVAASADATVDTYAIYMQLAVMSYVWGAPARRPSTRTRGTQCSTIWTVTALNRSRRSGQACASAAT